MFVCVFVCLFTVVRRLPGLFSPEWEIVVIITGFMEIYSAVMCGVNIISQKDGLTCAHGL